ncbi:glyoxalase domain-containing protein 5 [Penicillium alfredii]|uniref:Glyoxalase domain-containing protein 5 n=1 Tax=Penicillium alfredii TaxID=1506179 RepID=A0A9W9ER78_9EURO|nr:glyoxalase domain-containing protein 5 [Penicillium alfredii]KAJ5086502.1 glyoxalase domain-containing protein 5 [Penicillium alfredii]
MAATFAVKTLDHLVLTKINLHQSGNEFEPKAQNVQPGSADLYFVTDESVETVLQAFRDAKIEAY